MKNCWIHKISNSDSKLHILVHTINNNDFTWLIFTFSILLPKNYENFQIQYDYDFDDSDVQLVRNGT